MSNNTSDITEQKPLVVIRCVTYNHEAYIRDALEGFVMQKTNFPFLAVVHDDASTDGTAAIIREYALKYPGIIMPIIETENQCSKKDGSLRRIMDAAVKETGAKYVAYCEGDDYWTDPLKLQKQVDFMESNPDYSLCFTNADAVDAITKDLKYTFNSYDIECDSPIDDLIMRGGAFVPTATLLLRTQYFLNIPKEVLSQYAGDYCLQMYMGYIGKVRYLNFNSSHYRVASQGSWTQIVQNSNFLYRENTIWPLHKRLLDTMNCATENKYSKLFAYAMTDFMFWDCRRYGKYLKALSLYPKLYKPLKRYGLRCILELAGYGYIKRTLKRIVGKRVLQ